MRSFSIPLSVDESAVMPDDWRDRLRTYKKLRAGAWHYTKAAQIAPIRTRIVCRLIRVYSATKQPLGPENLPKALKSVQAGICEALYINNDSDLIVWEMMESEEKGNSVVVQIIDDKDKIYLQSKDPWGNP